MREEGIELSQRERERLKVLHEVPQGHWRQREAAGRLQWSRRQVRRLRRRERKQGDRGLIHRLQGRSSNRRIPAAVQQRVLAQVRRRYADCGPTRATLPATHALPDPGPPG